MADFHSLWTAALCGLGATSALAFLTWIVSLYKHDVSIVDSVWSILFVGAATAYVYTLPATGPRTAVMLVLLVLWALRLASYIMWRNWGEPEDRRYQDIRARNQPNFELKSLPYVFGVQAVLSWIASAPLLGGPAGMSDMNVLDAAGAALALFGIVFEAIADLQVAFFKRKPENKGRILDSGLWRYSRHPNYFGECCVWWGFYAMALSAGAWWAIVSPGLMTLLLLKVSGVALFEKDIVQRRPAYAAYIARTNAFIPGPPRKLSAAEET